MISSGVSLVMSSSSRIGRSMMRPRLFPTEESFLTIMVEPCSYLRGTPMITAGQVWRHHVARRRAVRDHRQHPRCLARIRGAREPGDRAGQGAGRASRGVPDRGAAHAAAERWDGDDRGRAVRAAVAVPDARAAERAVRDVGPGRGPPRRRQERGGARAARSARPDEERHAVAAPARGGRAPGGDRRAADEAPQLAPLLRQLITAYDASGLPPAYVPKDVT